MYKTVVAFNINPKWEDRAMQKNHNLKETKLKKDLQIFTFRIHNKRLSVVEKKQKKLNKIKKIINEKRAEKTNARYTIAHIDSLNLCSPVLSSFFINNDNYKVECLKNKSKHDTGKCLEYFGDTFLNETKEGKCVCPFVEIDAIMCHQKIMIPMKLHARSKKSPTVEFAGLKRYDDRADTLKMVLCEVSPYVQDSIIKRIDIAIDFVGRIPNKVHKGLVRRRTVHKEGTTRYYKTRGEGKRNPAVNIIAYDKGKKENLQLEKKLLRLEYQFLAPFIGKVMLKDIDELIKKIERRINKDTLLNIKVLPL